MVCMSMAYQTFHSFIQILIKQLFFLFNHLFGLQNKRTYPFHLTKKKRQIIIHKQLGTQKSLGNACCNHFKEMLNAGAHAGTDLPILCIHDPGFPVVDLYLQMLGQLERLDPSSDLSIVLCLVVPSDMVH